MTRPARVILLVSGALIFGGLVSASPAAAHRLVLAEVNAKAVAHAQRVVRDPIKTEFVKGYYSCAVGSDHWASCTVRYDTAATLNSKTYACTERLEAYHQAHGLGTFGDNFGSDVIFLRHARGQPRCSRWILIGPQQTPGQG